MSEIFFLFSFYLSSPLSNLNRFPPFDHWEEERKKTE